MEGDRRIRANFSALFINRLKELYDVDAAAHGKVIPALADRPRVFERAIERINACGLERLAHFDEFVPGCGNLEVVLGKDLFVVDDR